MNNRYKKVLIILLTVSLLFVNNVSFALAQEVNIPTPPPAPVAPTFPDSTNLNIPTPAPIPTAPPAPTLPPLPTPAPLPLNSPAAVNPYPAAHNNENNGNTTNNQTADSTPVATPLSLAGNQTGGQQSDGGSGGSVTTGNATNSASVITQANDNASITPQTSNPGITIQNGGNGAESNNNSSATVADNNQTTQNNSATVINNLNQSSITGYNSASKNTGGNSTIQTGSANTSGTLITAVNTNVDGVAVSEFNIADDYNGDIILDFSSNCISGCGGANGSISNTGNGSDSTNSAILAVQANNTTFQNNDATVENNMTLTSDSGYNKANRNTDGDSTITTGDANISANVLTFVNNNISGNVLYGVVNIYGDLVGDIVLPDSILQNANVSNVGNGAGSTNSANLNQTTNNTTSQFNTASIDNNINFGVTSGENDTSRNTDGSSSIQTGNASLTAQVLNVANTNVADGNMWLVIVNEAGKWVGRIIGAPEGSNFAGSQGTEFSVGPNGEITATNAGNGADSTNTSNVSTTSNNSAEQINNANIVNNLNLNANTGHNEASRNTGGNSSITTGDAQIIANLVNFVNNNITGKGKLVVTVVNVFGSWLGDFVTPGHQKETVNTNNDQHAIGGIDTTSINQTSDNTQNNTQTNVIDNTPILGVAKKAKNLLAELGGYSDSVDSTSDQQASVMGVTTQAVQAAQVANKTITINLAWILLLTPFILGIIIAKRRGKLLLPLKGTHER
jgi:hypothetical protein